MCLACSSISHVAFPLPAYGSTRARSANPASIETWRLDAPIARAWMAAARARASTKSGGGAAARKKLNLEEIRTHRSSWSAFITSEGGLGHTSLLCRQTCSSISLWFWERELSRRL